LWKQISPTSGLFVGETGRSKFQLRPSRLPARSQCSHVITPRLRSPTCKSFIQSDSQFFGHRQKYVLFICMDTARRGSTRAEIDATPIDTPSHTRTVMIDDPNNPYHTLARWCESVVRATMKVNGRGGNLTPRHQKAPQPMVTKICVRNYVGDIYHHAKLYTNRFRGFGSAHA